MAQADRVHSTPIPLSELFDDPLLRRAFRRAERDSGGVFAVPSPLDLLTDGAAEEIPADGELAL